MNRDDIIRMAEKAGMALGFTQGIAVMNHKNLERFAALVAAVEREACAKVCEDMETHQFQNYIGRDYAAAIRARYDE